MITHPTCWVLKLVCLSPSLISRPLLLGHVDLLPVGPRNNARPKGAARLVQHSLPSGFLCFFLATIQEWRLLAVILHNGIAGGKGIGHSRSDDSSRAPFDPSGAIQARIGLLRKCCSLVPHFANNTAKLVVENGTSTVVEGNPQHGEARKRHRKETNRPEENRGGDFLHLPGRLSMSFRLECR